MNGIAKATTEAPQRSLRHMISKTVSRAHLLSQIAPHPDHARKSIQWVHPKDRIRFWNITPGDKVLVTTGDAKIRGRVGTVGQVNRERNVLYLSDDFACRPKFREPPTIESMKNDGKEGYESIAVLTPRPIHYSNVRLVVGERETVHEVGDITYTTMDPIVAKRLKRSGLRYSLKHRRVVWDRKPEGGVYHAVSKPMDEIRKHELDYGKWPANMRRYVPVSDFDLSKHIPWPKSPYRKPHLTNTGLQSTGKGLEKTSFTPLSIEELTQLAEKNLSLSTSSLPNETTNVIEYKGENGRNLSAVDASVTEFFNPLGRGARTRRYTIAHGVKPRSGGRRREIQRLLNNSRRKGTALAILRMPRRRNYRDIMIEKTSSPLTEDKNGSLT